MPLSDSDVVKSLFAADAWQRNMVRSDTGKAVDCWHNVFYVLENHPAWKDVLAFDTFAQVPVKMRPAPTGAGAGPWMAEDDTLLGLWLAQTMKLTVKSLGNVTTGAIACAQRHPHHPVTSWLDRLAWDGTPRLGEWLSDCLGVRRSPYAQAVGRYFLLNMVARVYEPGCIMRSVPVLEGAQDTGKSTALRLLAGNEWFSDSHFDVAGKDVYELIQGVWLYEIGEMASFNKSEASRVKQFISSIKDSWVPKYVRGRVTVPRQVAFSGTTNESLYLKDWTGNTRFWPVLTAEEQPIDLDAIAGMREQLFAEAVDLFRKGARRYPTAAEHLELFGPEQSARVVEHPWLEPVQLWLASSTVITNKRVTSFDVLREGLSVEKSKMTVAMQQDVGRIMTALGWVRKRESAGSRKWFYERPEPVPADKVPQNGADPF
jgi:putative DNA primase/helicase